MPATARETSLKHDIRFGAPLPPLPLAGFVAAIFMLIVMAYLSYASLQNRDKTAAQVTRSTQVLTDLDGVLSALQDAETGQRGYLITGDASYLNPYENAKANLPGRLASLREILATQERRRQVTTLEELAQAKFAELDETIALRAAGNSEGALKIVRSDRGKVLMDRLRTLIAQMSTDERADLARSQVQWQAAISTSVVVVLAGSALLLVVIIGSAVATSRDYRARQRQSWIRVGHMRLAAELQGEQRIETLGEKALAVLADYMHAHVGALYITEGDGRLRRVAAHALEPQSGSTELSAGEGLLGQCAKENRVLRISDVPENYFSIASATGRARPRELLIAPASADGVQAVIELGFFRAVLPGDMELLAQASELLGIAVRTSKDRTRLEELLVQTQTQAEELQAQQEELRVTNEELEQQSNVLKESQARLETQQAELEQTNAQLEEHAQALGRQNDELEAVRHELSARAEELTRSNQFKSEFLANMSHELRTPLNSSLILAKLLADNPQGNLNDEQVKFANNIHSAGNDLLELINDILDLSKIEARKVDVAREIIGMPQLLDTLRQTFVPLAEQKDVELAIDSGPSVPSFIYSDSQRLRQVLRNLLSNALKFTPEGSVTLRVSAHTDAQGVPMISFAVIDTGIGIAPEQHGIIFEPFRQADGTTNRRYGGTGLGLSISRELAALLGGRIDLTSASGRGSTFILTIPQQLPPPAETPAASERKAPPTAVAQTAPQRAAPIRASQAASKAAPALGERVLLIIEDDPAFTTTLRELAQSLKYDCLTAATADEGVDLALRHRPTAIVLDIHLPDHTGLAVLDRLKHDPATRHIPIQVVSAFDYDQAALEMGAANVLHKPVDRDKLLASLEGLERKTLRGERAVLIVEDNTVQRDSICRLLESSTVSAVAVSSAAQALEQLRGKTFDCMVLDLSLPDASGFDLLQKMAIDESYSFPPVIVYTARSLSSAEEQQLRRYSRSIIIKGAKSPERLLDEVTLFLHKVESSLPAEQQRLLRVARSRDSVFESRVILLAEDDVRNVFAITRVLEPHGAKVKIARNGREAVEALETNGAIDLVLMDIMMPEMDGFEAMRMIRAQPNLAEIPIIALTAKAMPDDRQRCLDAGANDYITKPIDVGKLLSLLRIWLPPRNSKPA
jgi:CheY-like chemotaxis protein/signal transduction histidine kinase/CHASE3 domain sensor protein